MTVNSASRMPTRSPFCAATTAKLTVRDDLPTPPLPDAIPITRVRFSGWANGMNFSRPLRRIFLTLSRWPSDITPKLKTTSLTSSISFSAEVTSDVIRSCIGQPEIVRRTFIVTRPDSKSTFSTIPNSVMGRCNSGSCTFSNALAILSSVVTLHPDLFLVGDETALPVLPVLQGHC
jgi:hypothetical protein